MLVFQGVPSVVSVLLFVCIILFSSLTVTCDDQTLEIRFGYSPIRKKFLLKDIESYRPVRNPWYYGWGIRLTPHGWLFNVSGFDALEIQMKDGKSYRIGTNDPNGLARYLGRYISPWSKR